VGIFLAFLFTTLLIRPIAYQILRTPVQTVWNPAIAFVFAGMAMIHLTGLVDDFGDLRAIVFAPGWSASFCTCSSACAQSNTLPNRNRRTFPVEIHAAPREDPVESTAAFQDSAKIPGAHELRIV